MIYRLLIDQKGFGLLSIVFMMLTMSIAVITVMTVINPSTLTRQSSETVEKARVLRAGIQSYQFSHGGVSGTFPPALNDLVVTDNVACAIDNTPTNVTYLFLQGWCGPYADRVFTQNSSDFKSDGWGIEFGYNAGTGVITSCGPDRSCGGVDDLTFSP